MFSSLSAELFFNTGILSIIIGLLLWAHYEVHTSILYFPSDSYVQFIVCVYVHVIVREGLGPGIGLCLICLQKIGKIGKINSMRIRRTLHCRFTQPFFH